MHRRIVPLFSLENSYNYLILLYLMHFNVRSSFRSRTFDAGEYQVSSIGFPNDFGRKLIDDQGFRRKGT